jgi:hypothetical protein
VRYREPAAWQYLLLVALWVGAIVLVIVLVRQVPPGAQHGAAFAARSYGPIAAAFVLTLFVLVRPRGATAVHELRGIPEAYSLVTGRVRFPDGRIRDVRVTVPTVFGGGGLAREETLDLALAEAGDVDAGGTWVEEPTIREADPRERAAARAALEARDTTVPLPEAREPRSATGAVLMILLGCVWVSLVALAVVLVKDVYVRAALAPPCRAHAVANGLVYRGVELPLGTLPWWESASRREVLCRYENRWRNGHDEVPLAAVTGPHRAYLLWAAGALVVPVGGLLLWGAASWYPAKWLLRRYAGRRAATGPSSAP